MQPPNYMLNLPDPTQAVAQGVALSNTLTQSQWAKDDRATAQAQAARAQAAHIAMQNELYETSQKPTADNLNKLMIRHPQLAESFKNLSTNLGEKERLAGVNEMSPIFAALQNGRTDIARSLLVEQYDAANNSNDFKRSTAISTLLSLADNDPKALQTTLGLRLGALGGLDKFATTAETLAKTPEEVTKLGADTRKIAAETKEVAPNAKAERGLKGAQAGEATEKTKEMRDLRPGKIVLQGTQAGLEEAQADQARAKAAKMAGDPNAIIASSTAGLATIDRIFKAGNTQRIFDTDTWNKATGATSGLLSTNLNTLNFERQIESLKAQSFLISIQAMKNFGAISDAEGEKLDTAMANLSLKQSGNALKENVMVVKKVFEDSIANAKLIKAGKMKPYENVAWTARSHDLAQAIIDAAENK